MKVLEEKGKEVLLGNEAVTRGALEAGVDFVSTYPGTPASEIGNRFFEIEKSGNKIRDSFYFEYSTNEKVALEAGVGASFSGLKVLVAMKHFGLNVAQEALLPFMYTGTVGPTVIVVSDDPSCHSSAQSEQNTRFQALLAHIPVLEPSDPQEAKDFTKLAFKISEEFKLPVMVRLTTRVSHQRSIVGLSSLPKKKRKKGKFVRDREKFITMPPRVLEMKTELFEKIQKVRKISEASDLNFTEGASKLGIIVSGVSYLYVKEALEKLGKEASILKISFFYPLPERKIAEFLKGKKKVLVVEELEGIIEEKVRQAAKGVNCKVEVRGKDLLGRVGEFKPEMVKEAVADFSGVSFRKKEVEEEKVAVRSPRPCPGCPYWSIFGAVKEATEGEKVVFGGDIGCYMLAGIPQLGLQDYLSCMGSSLGIAHGIKKANPEEKLLAFIGDSTFFHAGMPALANMVFNGSNALVVIMDNQITAMTGQQPNPGEKVKIEEVVKGLGVRNLAVLDPTKEREKLIETVKKFLREEEVSVIIARSPCLFIR